MNVNLLFIQISSVIFCNVEILSDDRIVIGSSDGEIKIIDSHTGHIDVIFKEENIITSILISENFIISHTIDDNVRIFTFEGNLIRSRNNEIYQNLLVIPNDMILSTVTSGLIIWSIDGKFEDRLLTNSEFITKAALFSDTEVIFLREDHLEIWDLKSFRRIHLINKVSSYFILPNGNLILTSVNNRVSLYDIENRSRVISLAKKRMILHNFALLRDKRLINVINGASTNKIIIWS